MISCAPEGTRTPNLLIRRSVPPPPLPASPACWLVAGVHLVAAVGVLLGSGWGQRLAAWESHKIGSSCWVAAGRTGPGRPDLAPIGTRLWPVNGPAASTAVGGVGSATVTGSAERPDPANDRRSSRQEAAERQDEQVPRLESSHGREDKDRFPTPLSLEPQFERACSAGRDARNACGLRLTRLPLVPVGDRYASWLLAFGWPGTVRPPPSCHRPMVFAAWSGPGRRRGHSAWE